MKQRKVVLFAGTTEGRLIGQALVEHGNVEIHVATEYGKDLLPDDGLGYRVCEGRLDLEDMVRIMDDAVRDGQALGQAIPLVVDATHPYAVKVTENIKKAAEKTGAEYFRVLRGESSETDWKEQFKEQLIFAESIENAAEILSELGEKALITTGSKELLPFTKIEGYKELLTVRILPLAGAFQAAIDGGFEGRNLIAMQGPFSVDMNRALIKQVDAKVLVTKESGKQGGFLEKLVACKEENIKAIVIKRPTKETGFNVFEMLDVLESKGVKIVKSTDDVEVEQVASCCDGMGLFEKNESSLKRWFPIFMDSQNKNVLVVGGGSIATRRVETLCQFQWNVTVWAESVSDKIGKLEQEGKVAVEVKTVESCQVSQMDIDKFNMVIGATSDKKLNEEICRRAKEKGIFFNDAGCKENCNFYFPAISLKDDVTVGINGQGRNHKLVRQVREQIDGLLAEKIKG